MQTACEEREKPCWIHLMPRDNRTNGIDFTIRKVNLMFVFIVVVWTFFFNKYMIQNPVFFVYNVIMLSIVVWANLYVKLLMFSAKAAVNSFVEAGYRNKPWSCY